MDNFVIPSYFSSKKTFKNFHGGVHLGIFNVLAVNIVLNYFPPPPKKKKAKKERSLYFFWQKY